MANAFKNSITGSIGTTGVKVYETPANTSSYIDVTASHIRNGNVTRLIANTEIPTEDATSMLLGKLVLEAGDFLSVTSSLANSADVIVSVLEIT